MSSRDAAYPSPPPTPLRGAAELERQVPRRDRDGARCHGDRSNDRHPTQDNFDAICADLSKVTLGRAIATSTALPPLLTPITLENRAGKCGRKAPAWQTAAEAAGRDSETPGPALLRARALKSYEQPNRPYVHLFDGGLSENLGLTEVLMAFEGG